MHGPGTIYIGNLVPKNAPMSYSKSLVAGLLSWTPRTRGHTRSARRSTAGFWRALAASRRIMSRARVHFAQKWTRSRQSFLAASSPAEKCKKAILYLPRF
ncbi:hypothetical protein CDV36_016271 [Fusarium kuroshium]|uniref:Uncharacterized protein n=1 Tax=Fusarium kuroshium TaxID=2010991 RepID=A0A3M2QWB0_9HYPO|nr:hypothetical protein CDV36_016271 [Fusarium kuroshium]